MKQQFVLTHTFRQTEISSLLDTWITNKPSVKMLCSHIKIIVSPYHHHHLLLLNLRMFRLLSLFLSLNLNLVRPSCSRCFSLYSRKNITCLSVGLLMICKNVSVSCKIVYRWVTTNCHFMSDVTNRYGVLFHIFAC